MSFLHAEGGGVRILSLDGGDGRCLSQLLMLEELTHRLEYDHGRSVKPCEFFHSITGVGAGGVIAILLGVLGMTTDDASTAFACICEKVFAPDVCDEASRSERLELAMKAVMDEIGVSNTTRMEGGTDRGAGCHVSICYSAASINGCRMFRSCKTRQSSGNPTIVEAVRASWATPGLFSSIHFGPQSRQEELISAVHGFNNPMLEALREAREFFGKDRTVSTILSLGSGVNAPVSIYSSGFIQNSLQQTDITEDSIEHELGPSGIYFRFSPDHTIVGDIFTIRGRQIGSIIAYTRGYLERVKTIHSMESFLKTAARTSSIKLDFKSSGCANAATPPTQLPATSRLSRDEKSILSELRIAGLQCGSPVTGCMKGTREAILKKINDWTTNFDAPNILWLKGHPGVGKSAIATEIVEQLSVLRRLGSSFFFQRQNAAVLTPHALWRTVAYDLARKHLTVRRTVLSTLEEGDVSPTTTNLERLFRHFIHEPLIGSSGIPNARLPVVVVDALDECGGLDGQHSGQRRDLVNTLENWSRLPCKYKLIVTSRGENDIERLFSTIDYHPIEILAGQTVDMQSSEDIRVFLVEQLHQIALRYPRSLSPRWPGDEIITRLTERAAGLFIWAETFIKFVSRGEPEQLLSQVLEGGETGYMDTLYEQILSTAFPVASDKDVEIFGSVVGGIILAQAPLSFSSLAQLLSMRDSIVEHICNGLQSVLDSKDVLQFYHQSFVDFVLDKSKCPERYLINPQREHCKLAVACLETMRNSLRFNICGITSSCVRNVDVAYLDSTAADKIPPHLRYSSLWWAIHLVETKFDVETFGHLKYFMRKQFLCWLEVLSIIKRVNLGSQILSSLIDWILPHGQEDVLTIARDMQKFVATFATVISQSVPHIYLSALPFAPQSSAVSRQYMPNYPHTLVIQEGGLRNWPGMQNVLNGHGNRVLSVAWSPDGQRVVSGSADKTVRVWDVETGEVAASPFEGHGDWVRSVAFSPDENRIVSGSDDNTIRIWHIDTGKVVASPPNRHRDYIYSVAFSPDGMRVVSGSGDRVIRVWNALTAEMVADPFEGHKGAVSCVAFSPDGKRIVSGSEDRTIRVWHAETGERVAGPFKGHKGRVVYSVAFSPDGRRIISGSDDKTVRVWSTETGEVVTGPFEGHRGCVRSVAFSADGKRVVSGSHDKTIRVWDGFTGEVVGGPFEGHEYPICSVAFSPDGQHIVSGSDDNTVRIWNTEMGDVVTGSLEGHSQSVHSVACSPDGRHIASGSWDKVIRVWDAKTGKVVAGPFEGCVALFGFSPDGTSVVSGSEGDAIQIWDVDADDVVVESPFEVPRGSFPPTVFSQERKLVSPGPRDKVIQVWDVRTSSAVPTDLSYGNKQWVCSVAISLDGRRIVTVTDGVMVRVWDTQTGGMVAGSRRDQSGGIYSVALSPDGKRIASGCYDKKICVWDAEGEDVLRIPFEGHTHWVTALAFSPDGRRIVSGSYDNTIRVWDAKTGAVVAGPFEGHNDAVISVVFSPDGKRIVSGSDDNTIRVWVAETGRLISGPFEGHSDSVTSVAFSPNGKHIISGSSDKTIRVWDAPSHESENFGRHLSPFNISSRIKDGWILGPNSELLFWVPPPLRDGLWRPGNTLVVGKNITTRLNLDSFVYGESWALCKTRQIGPDPNGQSEALPSAMLLSS